MVVAAMACAAIQLTAMPTEEETRKAEPVVKKMLAQERAALESGKKTRSEVAAAAMKLVGEADTDAAKRLLMKGAFVLYVRDGNLEKAVETMKALKATIPDIPPQSVTNIIETALLGVSKKEDGAPLYKLLDESKADIASIGASSMVVKERNSIASILKGMIKVPGGDLWLSETELTQGQWEAVMGNNPSLHKGVNLPVENISRDECDIFLEKLNQTKEVQASQFKFCLPGRVEWAGAARAGNPDLIPWIKPGVAGELLDMAWLKENSNGETHAVATKVPNAFGFYDMVGNVHEWVIGAPETRGTKRGYSFTNPLSYCRPGHFFHHARNKRFADTGLRLAAHVRPSVGQPEQQHIPSGQLPVRPQVMEQKETTVPDNPPTESLDSLKKRLDSNLAKLKELRGKNPACYLNPKETSIINVGRKIATMKDRRYCTCNNVTFVRDAFYCSGCKRITLYKGNDDLRAGGDDYREVYDCKVCRQQGFYRWLEVRKKVDVTAMINARINELYKENESLEDQMRSIKRSDSRKR